jgi:hypothetical protein
MGVRSKSGNLFLNFRWSGRRCREFTSPVFSGVVWRGCLKTHWTTGSLRMRHRRERTKKQTGPQTRVTELDRIIHETAQHDLDGHTNAAGLSVWRKGGRGTPHRR